MKRTSALAPILAALIALATAACGSNPLAISEAVHTAEYSLAKGATVTVNADNASVTVRRSQSEKTKVSATLRNPEKVKFFILPQGTEPSQELRISATVDDTAVGQEAGAHIELEVPDGVALAIDTSNGAVELTSVNLGEVNVVTSNGAINIQSSKGDFALTTSNGPLTITGSEGTFWTQTSNGAVNFDGKLLPTRSSRFKTSGGNINIRLSADADITLTITASNGTVTAEGATTLREVSKVYTARYGEGNGSVTVETSNGNVSISRSGG
jgi:DUF4097 and DUF4098 domain-containing protein YvlB